MKAAVRAVLIYFTAFPVHRWLGCLAAFFLLLALGTRSMLTLTPALLFSFIYVFSVVGSAGVLLRAMSAPPTHRLLPYFRARMLAAVVIVAAAISLTPAIAAWAMMAASGAAAPALAGGFGGFFAMSMLVTSAIVLALYFGSCSSPWALLVLPIMAALSLVPQEWWSRLGTPTPTWAVPACLVLWIGFGAVYLRKRSIPGVGLAAPSPLALKLDDKLMRRLPEEVIAKTAISIWLTQRVRSRDAVVGTLAFLVVLLLLGLWLISMRAHFLSLVYMQPLVILAIVGGVCVDANRSARRTRSLWIRSGLHRTELFQRTEIALLTGSSTVAVAMTVWVAPMAFLLTEQRASLAWFFILSIAVLPSAVYLGLMAVRGIAMLELAAGAAVAVALIATMRLTMLTDEVEAPLALGVLGYQATLTLLFRTAAAWRWRRIDWLSFRPATQSSLRSLSST